MKIQNLAGLQILQASDFMIQVNIINIGLGFQTQTLPGSQAGKVDRKLYIGNLPDGTTPTGVGFY